MVRLMAYHPFRHLGLKFLSVAIAAGALVCRRRRADRRAEPAGAARLAEPAGHPGTGRQRAQAPVDVRVRGTTSQLSQLVAGDVVGGHRPVGREAGATVLPPDAPNRCGAPFGVEVAQVSPRHRPADVRAIGHAHGARSPPARGEAGRGYEVAGCDKRARRGRGGRPGERSQAASGGHHRADLGGREPPVPCARG